MDKRHDYQEDLDVVKNPDEWVQDGEVQIPPAYKEEPGVLVRMIYSQVCFVEDIEERQVWLAVLTYAAGRMPFSNTVCVPCGGHDSRNDDL